ncbi:hypothetical protein SDC9_105259 [bioreactor metagenome]|uniref:Uncharacterized protein n=1 Tax=bioreactor metagenome TaxID=1076179 RepID=A0A645B051_9ZZZZ
MRKLLIVTTVILLAFLSACGSAPAAATSAASTSADTATAAATEVSSTTSALATDYTDAATVEQQLLAGTLQLEGTDNAVTVDQANQLLTLWQSLNTFGPGGGQPGNGGPQGGGQPGGTDSQSTPEAPADQSTPQAPADQAATSVDTEAVLAQIEAIFTDAQIQAISAMQLTNASITTYITDNNLSMQRGNGQGGDQQQGNPPYGDGTQPQGNPPSADGTMQAPGDGQQPDMTNQVLLRAVIQLLQEKTGTTVPQAQ